MSRSASPPTSPPVHHSSTAEVPTASAQAPPATSLPTRGVPADTVTFRMFASARAAAGTAEVRLAPGPTTEVVAALAEGLPLRFAAVLASSSLLADGVRLERSSTAPIPGGTIVDVLPPFAGG